MFFFHYLLHFNIFLELRSVLKMVADIIAKGTNFFSFANKQFNKWDILRMFQNSLNFSPLFTLESQHKRRTFSSVLVNAGIYFH